MLEAYHNGLKVPEDVTLSYHGDPASWIWLSPLSTTFLSTELTKAYTYGARKIWVFNVGDIKPAEKEISFVMDMAWDVNRWKPALAHNYIKYWVVKTFGGEVAQEIADLQADYYRLQAGGKDAHVCFLMLSEQTGGHRAHRRFGLYRWCTRPTV